MKTKRTSLTFDLPADLKRKVIKAAAESMISASAYIRQALANHLNRNYNRKGRTQ